MSRLLVCCALVVLQSRLVFASPKPAARPFLVAERSVHCGASWVLSFFPNGRVEQVTTDTCVRPRHSKRTLTVAPETVRLLQGLVAEAQFTALPALIKPEGIVTDEDRLVLTVWPEGHERSVSAEGLERSTPSPEAHRFLVVWSAVLEAVASAGQ